VAEAYAESWRQGIKAVAIYRDGSKGTQPLNVSMDAKKEPSALDAVGGRVLGHLAASQPAAEADVKLMEAHSADKVEVSAKQLLATAQAFQKALDEVAAAAAVPVLTATPAPAMNAATEIPRESQDLNAPPRAIRHRLQEERASITHKFSIAGHEGYITVGLYPNGQPGEIFIRMAKEGSTVSGLMDAFATSISLALQHGVPLKVLCEKFAHTRFEPSGWTGNEQIGYAKSLMDYMFRWLSLRFLSGQQLTLFQGLAPQAPQLAAPPNLRPESDLDEDEPAVAPSQMARLVEEVAKRLSQVTTTGSAHSGGGIPPEPQAGPGGARRTNEAHSQSVSGPAAGSSQVPSMHDRGLYHAADAMRDMYDMGDAPSCGTCGAIMVRNGSCYRCMSCGSTSGCS
jgi:ribonucleoside-diphosphate reductase alpha chain